MVATADWIADPPGSMFSLRLGCEHVSSAPNPQEWSFSNLSHSASLHGAGLITLAASSRPQRACGEVSEDTLEDAASEIGLDGIRREEPLSDLANVVLKLPDGSVEVIPCTSH
jgi:hypothetical protein